MKKASNLQSWPYQVGLRARITPYLVAILVGTLLSPLGSLATPQLLLDKAQAGAITTSGLILNLDANDQNSIDTAGATVWKDLSGNGYNAIFSSSGSYNGTSYSVTNNTTNRAITFVNGLLRGAEPGALATISKPIPAGEWAGFSASFYANMGNVTGGKNDWSRVFDFSAAGFTQNSGAKGGIFISRFGTSSNLHLGFWNVALNERGECGAVGIIRNDTLTHYAVTVSSNGTCKWYRDDQLWKNYRWANGTERFNQNNGSTATDGGTLAKPVNVERTSLRIGRSHWNDRYLDGSIRNLAIYNIALSDTQRTTTYNGQIAAYTSASPTLASASITGTARVGTQLTAQAGAITGSGTTTTYQWQSAATAAGSYSNIASATTVNYTPVLGDAGRFIKVVITVTNSFGNVSQTSSATSAVLHVAPTIASASINGTARVGTQLTAQAGAITGSSTTTAYQWQSAATSGGSYSNIASATAVNYTPVLGDAGRFIKVVITVTNTGGSASQTSAATTAVLHISPTLASATITGTARVGTQLTAVAGAITGSETTTAYQWQNATTSGGSYSNIASATSVNYTPVLADAGKFIKVIITINNTGGSAPQTSAATSAVLHIAPTLASASITGTAKVGVQLVAVTGAITGSETSTAYQWQSATTSGGTYSNIESATASTFTPVLADAGKFIKVIITISNTGGSSAQTSLPTSVVIEQFPTIGTVTAPSNGTYKPTDTPTFTITFSESVTVTGTPRLSLVVGSFTQYANFISQSDSRTALFRYTVSSAITEFDTDGISITNSVDLNGGLITDLFSNPLASLVFTVPSTSNIFVAQPPAVPIIDSATAGSRSISIYFTPGSIYGTPITNYQYSTNNGANWTTRSPVDTSTVLRISGLTNGTSYQVRIRAVSAVGVSDSSTSITARPNAVAIAGGSNISTTFGIVASTAEFTSTGGVGPYLYTLASSVPGVSVLNGIVSTSSTLSAGAYSLVLISTDSFLASETRTVTINVSKAAQERLTISSTTGVFQNTPSVMQLSHVGGNDIGAVTYEIVSGGSASGCSIAGSQLSVNSVGTCELVATKAATSDYLIAYSDTTTVTFSQIIYYEPAPTQLVITGQNALDLTQTIAVPAVTGVFLVDSTYEINGNGFIEVTRVVIGGQDATVLSNTPIKIVIDSAGVMPGPLFIECSDGRVGPSPFYFFTP